MIPKHLFDAPLPLLDPRYAAFDPRLLPPPTIYTSFGTIDDFPEAITHYFETGYSKPWL